MEFYADGFTVSVNQITATLDFTISVPQGGVQIVARARLNPVVCKLMTMMLRKAIKEIEYQGQAPIPVNRDVLNQAGIALEDW